MKINIQSFCNEKHKEIYKWIESLDTPSLSLLHAPMESGKTYLIKELIKSKKDLRIALLMPTKLLVNNQSDGLIPCGSGEAFKLANKGKSMISTWDTFEDVKHYDIIFIDEGGLFPAHSSFRDIVLTIVENINTKVILVSGTPNVTTKIASDTLTIKRDREIYKNVLLMDYEKLNTRSVIDGVIWKAKKNTKKTYIIRLNDKEAINDYIDILSKNKKLTVRALYSTDNYIYGQSKEVSEKLLKGDVRGVDILFTTSLIDTGISLIADRNIEFHCVPIVSRKEAGFENAVNVAQMSYRLRENSPYKMKTFVHGKRGRYSIEGLSDSYNTMIKKKLLSNMQDDFDVYSDLILSDYTDYLSKVGVNVNHYYIRDKKNLKIIHNAKRDKISIIKHLRHLNFIKYEQVIKDMNKEDRDFLNGLQIDKNEVKNTVNYMALNDVFKEIKKSVDNDIKLSTVISDRGFESNRINNIVKYNKLSTDAGLDLGIILDQISDAIESGIGKIDTNRLNALNTSEIKTIKSYIRLFFKRVQYGRGGLQKLIIL